MACSVSVVRTAIDVEVEIDMAKVSEGIRRRNRASKAGQDARIESTGQSRNERGCFVGGKERKKKLEEENN